MKTLLALSLLLTTPVFATWDEPEAVDVNQEQNQVAISASESLAVSHAASLSSSSSSSSNSLVGGSQTLNLTLPEQHMSDIYNNHTFGGTNIYTPAAPMELELGRDCVGEVCQSTGAVGGSVGYNEGLGANINLGFILPVFGRNMSNAMDLEEDRLTDTLRQTKERHQGEMAQVCMLLHEQMTIVQKLSQELWDRCYAYIPPSDHVNTVDLTNGHVIKDGLHQASPHGGYRE